MTRTARHAAPARRRPRLLAGAALLLVLAGGAAVWSVHEGGPAPTLVAEVAPVPTTSPAPVATPPTAPEAPAPEPVPAPENACGAAEPVVVAAGPTAAVSICAGPDGLTYHGTRASDGASTTLPASAVGSTWVAESGAVAYRVGDGELLLTQDGTVLETQVLTSWWVRQG